MNTVTIVEIDPVTYDSREVSHLPDCSQVAAVRKQEEYLRRYPEACAGCSATGTAVFYETHGFSYGSPQAIADLCGCLDSGRCPRCGGYVAEMEGVTGDYFRCVGPDSPESGPQRLPGCGWTDSPGCEAPEYAPINQDPPGWQTCSCGAREERT